MSRNRNRRNSKRPMSQPPPTAILEEDSPPSSRVRRELQDSDSERTFSSEPSNTSAPMSGRASPPSSNLETDDKRVLIHVIGPETKKRRERCHLVRRCILKLTQGNRTTHLYVQNPRKSLKLLLICNKLNRRK